LRAFNLVAAAALGLVAGVFSTLPFLLAAANLYALLEAQILPADPTAKMLPLLMLGLYAVWFLVIWAIKGRVAAQLNFIILFFFVLPLPSILIAYWWAWGKSFAR
jgi:hypothetical protein